MRRGAAPAQSGRAGPANGDGEVDAEAAQRRPGRPRPNRDTGRRAARRPRRPPRAACASIRSTASAQARRSSTVSGAGASLDAGEEQAAAKGRRRRRPCRGHPTSSVPLRNVSHGEPVSRDATWDTAERVEHGQPRFRGAAGLSPDCGEHGRGQPRGGERGSRWPLSAVHSRGGRPQGRHPGGRSGARGQHPRGREARRGLSAPAEVPNQETPTETPTEIPGRDPCRRRPGRDKLRTSRRCRRARPSPPRPVTPAAPSPSDAAVADRPAAEPGSRVFRHRGQPHRRPTAPETNRAGGDHSSVADAPSGAEAHAAAGPPADAGAVPRARPRGPGRRGTGRTRPSAGELSDPPVGPGGRGGHGLRAHRRR